MRPLVTKVMNGGMNSKSDQEVVIIDDNPHVLKEIIDEEEYLKLDYQIQGEYVETATGVGRSYKLYNPNILAKMTPIGKITQKGTVAKNTKSSRSNPASEVRIQSGHWRLPSYDIILSKAESKSLSKRNKYLKAMQNRIRKAVARDNHMYAAKLGMVLIQRSVVFGVYVLTRTCKGYFGQLSEQSIGRAMNKYYEFTRELHYKYTSHRFYIAKGQGKYRPIGCPNLGSKMVFKALEIILRELIGREIGDYQHGFMGDKGCQSATKEIISKLREDREAKAYEFDLKSFFNKVNVIHVCGEIMRKFGRIGLGLRVISVGSVPRIPIKHLKEEEELKYEVSIRHELGFKKRLTRYGFPQGSPLSPLLCNYALEKAGMGLIKGLIMYADDGIVIAREMKKSIVEILEESKARMSGIELAKEKSYGETREFKFLGINYDLSTRTAGYEERYETIEGERYHIPKTDPKYGTADRQIISMIDIDTATEEEIKELSSYSSYARAKTPRERIIVKDSMVRNGSGLEFHVDQIMRRYGLSGNIATWLGGVRAGLRSLKSAPLDEGGNDSGASTVFAQELVNRVETRGELRRIEDYRAPAWSKGLFGRCESGFRPFVYESLTNIDMFTGSYKDEEGIEGFNPSDSDPEIDLGKDGGEID